MSTATTQKEHPKEGERNSKVPKAATIEDVARLVGVSKVTVSNVLNGKRKTSPHYDSIMAAVKELDFKPNPHARRLSNGGCFNTVGYLSLDIDVSVRTRQLQIIQGRLNDLGYSVPLYAYGYQGSMNPANQMNLIESLVSQRPLAIVCNASYILPEGLAALQRYVDEGGICVCYCFGGSVPVDCDQVIFDSADAHYQATRHLLQLGHRKIGLFSVGHRLPGGALLEGFEKAHREFGIDVSPQWLFPSAGQPSYEEQGAMLAQTFLAMKKRPTAMRIANDYAALAFVSVVKNAGLDVPGDVSVIGDNDDPVGPYGMVPLCTVTYPLQSIAEMVIDFLQSRTQQRFTGAARHVKVQGELVLRKSTARFEK